MTKRSSRSRTPPARRAPPARGYHGADVAFAAARTVERVLLLARRGGAAVQHRLRPRVLCLLSSRLVRARARRQAVATGIAASAACVRKAIHTPNHASRERGVNFSVTPFKFAASACRLEPALHAPREQVAKVARDAPATRCSTLRPAPPPRQRWRDAVGVAADLTAAAASRRHRAWRRAAGGSEWVAAADADARNLLVLLHGLGDEPEPFAKFARQMALPQTAALALRAPLPLPAGIEIGRAWFDAFEADGALIAPKSGERRRVRGLEQIAQNCARSSRCCARAAGRTSASFCSALRRAAPPRSRTSCAASTGWAASPRVRPRAARERGPRRGAGGAADADARARGRARRADARRSRRGGSSTDENEGGRRAAADGGAAAARGLDFSRSPATAARCRATRRRCAR